MEITISSMVTYFMVMTDFLLIPLCIAIISQQDLLIHAFKNIGHEEKPQISKFFNKYFLI